MVYGEPLDPRITDFFQEIIKSHGMMQVIDDWVAATDTVKKLVLFMAQKIQKNYSHLD
jgi:hypothetical protein